MSTNNLTRLPSNIYKYNSFYKFLEAISNYITESTQAINTFINLLKPISGIDINTSLSIIQRLASVSGVVLTWLPQNLQNDVLKKLYKLALFGKSVGVLSSSDAHSLTNIVTASAGNITSINIASNTEMVVLLDVKLPSDSFFNLDTRYLIHYLIPQITGVTINTTISDARTLTALPLLIQTPSVRFIRPVMQRLLSPTRNLVIAISEMDWISTCSS